MRRRSWLGWASLRWVEFGWVGLNRQAWLGWVGLGLFVLGRVGLGWGESGLVGLS